MIAATLFVLLLPFTKSDFTYTDFNSTAGLAFNGAVEVTDCGGGEGEASAFVETTNTNTTDPSSSSRLHQFGHTATLELSTTVETANHSSSNNDIALYTGVFGHRQDDFDVATDAGCSGRIRLTPSHPSKAGSVWYDTRVPVLRGFETTFSWKITDHSKECSIHTDRKFAQFEHESCAVHGGDGFAFVIHGDPADETALGEDGEQIGYGGISNSGKTTLSMILLSISLLFSPLSLYACHMQSLSSLTRGQM